MHAQRPGCGIDAAITADRRRKFAVNAVRVLHCKSQLLEIIVDLRACRGFTHLLHGGNEHGYQNSYDGNHHKKFDEGKPRMFDVRRWHISNGYSVASAFS